MAVDPTDDSQLIDLDPVSDCPAAQVADWHIESVYDDTFALKELADLHGIIPKHIRLDCSYCYCFICRIHAGEGI